jgi:hypothetical protein
MKTIDKQRTLPESLIGEAYEALLDKMGRKKATQVWQVLVPSRTNYLDIRDSLFEGKGIGTLSKEIRTFNKKRKKKYT